MTSAQHAAWIAKGKPWELARPLARLRDRLRAYGYTVYDIGNDQHLDHQPPEDHTPYSATGWPTTTAYGWVTAVDVMPPAAGSGLPSLAILGAQIHADRVAGLPGVAWLKYMNWEPAGPDGPCYHDSWQPSHARQSSTDRGHIHISSRSDVLTSTAGDDYDPVARIRALREGDDMAFDDADRAMLQEVRSVLRMLHWGWTPTAAEWVKAGGDPAVYAAVGGGALVPMVRQLTAAAAADEVRDRALQAALDAVRAGGTSMDTAAVVAAVQQVGTDLGTQLAALRDRAEAAEAERDHLQQRLAAALAENE